MCVADEWRVALISVGLIGGYVAADLTDLIREAVDIFFKRESDLLTTTSAVHYSTAPFFTTEDNNEGEGRISRFGGFVLECVIAAKQIVYPSCLRGDVVKIPTVRYISVNSSYCALTRLCFYS